MGSGKQNNPRSCKCQTKNETRATFFGLRMCAPVWFDTQLVFSIHNEVLQNARSLHISLGSHTTCINNSALAKRFQEKTLPGLAVRMRSANTTLFLLRSCFPLASHLLRFALNTGGIKSLKTFKTSISTRYGRVLRINSI